MKGTIKHGSFGKTSEDVTKITGKTNYDVEMTSFFGANRYAVITDNGSKLVMSSIVGDGIDELSWITNEELRKLIENGDSAHAIPCPYKIQPQNTGKLVWISGPPGAGKSTSAQLLGRNAGYVYYEADCVLNHGNPYIPVDVENPSLSQRFQKHIKV